VTAFLVVTSKTIGLSGSVVFLFAFPQIIYYHSFNAGNNRPIFFEEINPTGERRGAIPSRGFGAPSIVPRPIPPFGLFMAKPWIQHDINCHLKKGLAEVKAVGGPFLYGSFWLIIEAQGVQNYSKDTFEPTLSITDESLRVLLGSKKPCSRKIAERTIKSISEILEWRFSKIERHKVQMWKIEIPKSLKYMGKRFKNRLELELELEREGLHVQKSKKKSQNEGSESKESEAKMMTESGKKMMVLQGEISAFENWPGGKGEKIKFMTDLAKQWDLCKTEAQYLATVGEFQEKFDNLLLG